MADRHFSFNGSLDLMKKILVFLLGILLSPMAFSGEWFVASNGNDADPGTKDKPFATISRARDAIRSAKADGDNGPWTVRIAEGNYELVEPIRFEPQDSGNAENPVLYIGEGTKTVLNGARSLDGWRKADVDSGGDVWVVDLPVIEGRKVYFEQLWINGRRAARARHPNSGFFKPKEVRQEIPINEKNPPKSFTAQSIIAQDGDLDFLKEIPEAELKFGQFIIHHHWDTTRRILLGYDAEQGELKMQGAPMKHWNPWRTTSQYYIENVRSAFDQAGEWFYDGVGGKVYYRPMPGEQIESSRFLIPRNGLNQLLVLRGDAKNDKRISHIRFEKITLAYTDSPRRPDVMKGAHLDVAVTGDLNFPGPSQINPHQAAFWADAVVEVDTARNISFVDCEITNVGEYGIRLQNADACRIERCALTDLGAGGIRIGGSGKTTNNVVDNCIIHRGGRLHACCVAVWIGNNTEDNRVTHNDIGDFYYTGISAGWTWGYKGGVAFRNIIEFNRIHDLGQGALADMGGVYTLGTSHGTRVCNNVIFNVESYAYGGWGLYTDEGSEGILMENNLVYDTTDGSFHQHYGKHNTIRNNILAFSRPHQIAVTRVENHLSLTFENNIVLWDTGKAIGYQAEKARVDYGSNLWWNLSGEVDFKGKTHKDWLDLGKDVGGMVADPKFVDVEKRNFRLQEDSPAEKIGFVPFDFDKAGVYGEEAWKQRAAGK